ncbi:hypothetical protein ACMT1E_09555 [Sphingomonas flavalba]|uniref:maleate cis-trans isomerase family protein n=1 Tax=Sphingomonas flavalba TaxID=2559804 RepID=UPI0039DF3B39
MTTIIDAAYDGGPGERAVFGLLTTQNDMVSEQEVRAFLPERGIALCASRFATGTRGTVETLRAIEAAIPAALRLLLPDDRIDVINFSCTSATVVIGTDRVEAAIASIRPDCAQTNPVTTAIAAMRHLGMRSIGLLTPYLPDVHQRMEACFASQGIGTATGATFATETEAQVRALSPDRVRDAAIAIADAPAIDGVFISCTALRCSGIIAAIEQATGKPVVTSNQAAAWHMRRLAGIAAPIPGFGRLLAR